MADILIAGCGDVGTALGLILTRAGDKVWGLKRNPDTLPAALQALPADLSKPAALANLPPVDYVFYTAAAGGFTKERYQSIYADGVANLLQALQTAQQRIKRFFFISSTSVYGQHDGEWVDEHSPAEADSFAGQCLRAGEQLSWKSPYPATVVRFAGIYGPGRTRLLDSIKNGQARCKEGVYTNRIHRDDCAAMLAHLLRLPEPETRPLYIGVDNKPALHSEVVRWLAQQMRVAAPGVSTAKTRTRSNKRCRNQRLLASGFRFIYPSYKEGYAALLSALPD